MSDTQDAPALRFRDIVKRFGSAVSLDGVGFDVPRGALFGLVGANGAGKTTLIKCLLDASRPDGGRIDIDGMPSTAPGARAGLAFLPERFTAPFYLTGRDFLALMGRLYRAPTDETAMRGALEELDLDAGALDKPVRAFSKGMTQKLGLAGCLLSGRGLLILDEPTSGLDPKARAALKAALKRRHSQGTTIFLTSHALADVDELCDHMAVLHRGRLCFAGAPAGLRESEGAATLEAAFLARVAAAERDATRAA